MQYRRLAVPLFALTAGADGALTVHLADAQAGTPENGCVRGAGAGTVLSPAPGSAGSVLQPVH